MAEQEEKAGAAEAAEEAAATSRRGPAEYKLTYFNARGRGEITRLMFLISGTPFEDDRVPIDFHFGRDNCVTEAGKHAGWEMIRPEFEAALAAGEYATGMGQLPILTVTAAACGARQIGQSMAIERYVARETGFLPIDPVEAAQVDQVAETARDIKVRLQAAKRGGNEANKAKFFAKGGGLQTILKKAELSLPPAEASRGPWLVGGKVSLADLSLFGLLTDARAGVVEQVPFIDDAEATTAAFQDCPRIKAAVEACAALPAVQKHLAGRPETLR